MEQDLASSAYHEAGHIVAYANYRRTCWAVVKHVEEPDILRNKTSHGQTFTKAGVSERPLTAFETSVVGWAGPFAELYHRTDSCEKDWFSDYLNDWYYRIAVEEAEVYTEAVVCSESDRSFIRRYPRKFRSFKSAAKLVADEWAKIEHVARHLIMHGEYPNDTTTKDDWDFCNGPATRRRWRRGAPINHTPASPNSRREMEQTPARTATKNGGAK